MAVEIVTPGNYPAEITIGGTTMCGEQQVFDRVYIDPENTAQGVAVIYDSTLYEKKPHLASLQVPYNEAVKLIDWDQHRKDTTTNPTT